MTIPAGNPVLISWSGGKDSCLALRELQRTPDVHVAALVTTVTRDFDRISMHGVRRVLLERQAASLGLPVHLVEISKGASNQEYEAAMGQAFNHFHDRGITSVGFGDLFLEDVRAYRQRLLERHHMVGRYPIWGRDTGALIREFIGRGFFETVVVCVTIRRNWTHRSPAVDRRAISCRPAATCRSLRAKWRIPHICFLWAGFSADAIRFARPAKPSFAMAFGFATRYRKCVNIEMRMLKERWTVLAAMILAAALSCSIPHPPNLASVSAELHCRAAHIFPTGAAFLVPLTALLLSDLVLGFYRGMPVVYCTFALIVWIGQWLQTNRSGPRILGAALTSSVLFFLTTNFDVWAFGSMYPMTFGRLLACYVAAIPFFWNTVQGDLLHYSRFCSAVVILPERRFTGLRETAMPRGG